MRLFCGARLPLARAIALRGSARYSSSSLRTPPRRSFRRHCAPLNASGALSKWGWDKLAESQKGNTRARLERSRAKYAGEQINSEL